MLEGVGVQGGGEQTGTIVIASSIKKLLINKKLTGGALPSSTPPSGGGERAELPGVRAAGAHREDQKDRRGPQSLRWRKWGLTQEALTPPTATPREGHGEGARDKRLLQEGRGGRAESRKVWTPTEAESETDPQGPQKEVSECRPQAGEAAPWLRPMPGVWQEGEALVMVRTRPDRSRLGLWSGAGLLRSRSVPWGGFCAGARDD